MTCAAKLQCRVSRSLVGFQHRDHAPLAVQQARIAAALHTAGERSVCSLPQAGYLLVSLS